ncbi:MAG: cytochrome c maturation protein CcmE [Myxococcota bacterium]
MSPNAKRQLIAVAAMAVAGGALAYVALGDIDENLVYYWEPQELLARGEAGIGKPVRLGGVVKNESVDFDEQSLELTFAVGIAPEQGGPTVNVNATGAPPQMFREGIGVVVEGKYDGSTFAADRVLVKHSNEYRAPEDEAAADAAQLAETLSPE